MDRKMTIEMRGFLLALTAGLIVVGVAFGIAAIIRTPSPGAPLTAPAASPSTQDNPQSLVLAGTSYFNTSCSSCHGVGGVGGGGAPSLQNEDWSDAKIVNIVQHGKGPMPPFAGTYNDKQISEIIAYIRTLN
jgi:mono/diheme cytochrome c family protein